MAEDFDFSEFLDVFIQEASEQIEKIDDGLLSLEKTPEDTDILNAIFRAAHTLKGSSAAMGFMHIRDLTHDAENLLDQLRSSSSDARIASVDSLLATTAVLKAFVEGLTAGDTSGASLQADVDAARKLLAEAIGQSSDCVDNKATSAMPDGEGTRFLITFQPDCQMPGIRAFMALQMLESVGTVLWTHPAGEESENLTPADTYTVALDLPEEADPHSLAARVTEISEIAGCEVASEQAQNSDHSKTSQSISNEGKPARAESAESLQTIRVAVDRLDTLVNLVGELVVDRTGLALIETALADRFESDESVQSLRSISSHLGRIVGDLHDEIMKMRMLPVGQVFRRYPRMVRDTSHNLGKKVELILEGEETGLDRSILEDIVDPLTHLLRNSVDHGIELPDVRVKAGKPETGRVVLSARHEEGHIVIEIEDDGKGIDPSVIREAAVRKGAISQEAASKLDDRESLMLLFQSGVSTAERVTDLSGRGVGMDVVKSNIEKLHGQLEVASEYGKGSRFTVRLPLTLAIVKALIVRSDEKLFALPLTSVVSATIENASKVHHIDGVPCVVIRDRTLPLLSASTVYERSEFKADADEEMLVVILQSRGQQAAFAVDELIGNMDIVVKSLGTYLDDVVGFSGAAILGDGHIALIVDVASMLDMISKRKHSHAA